MSTYEALFENGLCCTPTAGGLLPRVPEGCNRPMDETSAPVCTLQETSLDVCLARGLRLRRSAWPGRGRRAACLRSTESASRWHAGAAGESFQGGHGRGAGRRRWVGSREKWLYFSYTPVHYKQPVHKWVIPFRKIVLRLLGTHSYLPPFRTIILLLSQRVTSLFSTK